MDSARADKATVRGLWRDKVAAALAAAGHDESVPVYSTLPGKYALDLEELHRSGIIGRLSNGAIDTDDAWKVAAIESNSDAFMTVREAWPGLDIRRADIKSVLASDAPTRWPEGPQKRYCRGRVINLDYNGAFAVQEVSGAIEYPQVRLVEKLAQLHKVKPELDWTLCLTLAADIQWLDAGCSAVKSFLRENCDENSDFAEECRRILGPPLFKRLMTAGPASWMRALTASETQRMLMALVPKRILHDTYLQRWAVSVDYCLCYGGRADAKAMVSFIVDFKREPRVAATPRAVYNECLGEVLRKAALINESGQIVEI